MNEFSNTANTPFKLDDVTVDRLFQSSEPYKVTGLYTLFETDARVIGLMYPIDSSIDIIKINDERPFLN